MLLGLEAKPLLVKSNVQQLEIALGITLRTVHEIRDAALALIKKGARSVIVSMGKTGAMFVDRERALYAPALDVPVQSTVGAGDAMVCGILLGLAKDGSLAEALRYGMAAGAASVMTEGTQLLRLDDFQALIPKVRMREV